MENNSKLNIAVFMDNFYPQINGVVTSAINTCRELDKRGHNVYGVAPMPEDFDNYADDYFNYPLHFVKGFEVGIYPDFQFSWPFDRELLNVMREFKPDIIHFHAPMPIGFQAIRIARELGVPVVGTFHTFFAEPEYLSIVGLEKWKWLQRFGWWYSNFYFSRCDGVVSPGIATASFLKQKGLKKPIEIISNGVEGKKYRSEEFTNITGVEPDQTKKWILYVGRVSKEKCMDELIRAFELVYSKDKDAALLIVGDGPYRKELNRKTDAGGFAGKIVYTGAIPNKDLLESGIFQKVKLFVTASTSENQPMTILESIAFGLPIVGVDAKGVPELVEENGFIVPPGKPHLMADRILEIINNDELRKKLCKISLDLSEKYDITNTTVKMESYYRTIIEKFKDKS